MEIAAIAICPLTEAKLHFSRLVRMSRTQDVLVTFHGHPASMIISAAKYEEILNRLHELEAKVESNEE